jgi:hypothetical protein
MAGGATLRAFMRAALEIPGIAVFEQRVQDKIAPQTVSLEPRHERTRITAVYLGGAGRLQLIRSKSSGVRPLRRSCNG